MMIEGFDEQLPDEIKGVVSALLDADETPRLLLAGDLDYRGRFGTSWLVATNLRLIVLSPLGKRESERPEPQRSTLRLSRPRPGRGTAGRLKVATPAGAPTPMPGPYHLTHLRLARIREVKARETVGGGALQVELAPEQEGDPPARVDIIRFSRGLLLRFGDAAHVIRGLRQEEAEQAGAELLPQGKRRRPKTRCAHCGRALPPGSETCPRLRG